MSGHTDMSMASGKTVEDVEKGGDCLRLKNKKQRGTEQLQIVLEKHCAGRLSSLPASPLGTVEKKIGEDVVKGVGGRGVKSLDALTGELSLSPITSFHLGKGPGK